MIPQPYETMSPIALMYLCDWREAEGEKGLVGKIGVAWSILNRADHPGWWGHDIQSVILAPYQYSSFNKGSIREKEWPEDDQPAFIECKVCCDGVYARATPDPTDGAQFYHDISIPTPVPWIRAGYILTLEVGRFRFFREP